MADGDPRALLALGRVGANLIATPEHFRQAGLATMGRREVLRQLGIPEEAINRIAPGSDTPPFQSTGGKILKGIGQTGNILATALGAGVPPAQTEIGPLVSAQQLQYTKRESRQRRRHERTMERIARDRERRAERLGKMNLRVMQHSLGREDRERQMRQDIADMTNMPDTPDTLAWVMTGDRLPREDLRDLLIKELNARAGGEKVVPAFAGVPTPELQTALLRVDPTALEASRILGGSPDQYSGTTYAKPTIGTGAAGEHIREGETVTIPGMGKITREYSAERPAPRGLFSKEPPAPAGFHDVRRRPSQ